MVCPAIYLFLSGMPVVIYVFLGIFNDAHDSGGNMLQKWEDHWIGNNVIICRVCGGNPEI